MERGQQYNIPMLGSQLQDRFGSDIAYASVNKWMNFCIKSYNEHTLLPTEEQCLRHCFIKSHDFFNYVDNELKFFLRTQARDM